MYPVKRQMTMVVEDALLAIQQAILAILTAMAKEGHGYSACAVATFSSTRDLVARIATTL
jgi:hypothetical protein